MANSEHVEMLKESVANWNKWREENPGVRPDLLEANLSGAHLIEANLQGAVLSGAILNRAILLKANLAGANLIGAKLIGTILLEADLARANMGWAILSKADLGGASLKQAILTGVDLSKANLNNADMSGADLKGTILDNANVQGIVFDRNIKCRGIRCESSTGSPRFKRFAHDQDFIEELQETGNKGKALYHIWNIFADCGRTPWRWCFWLILFACYFGSNYYLLGPESFRIPGDTHLPFTFFTMIYYSITTITTLGFGDITPITTTAACWIIAEVIAGFLMLAGLISICATILARRS